MHQILHGFSLETEKPQILKRNQNSVARIVPHETFTKNSAKLAILTFSIATVCLEL